MATRFQLLAFVTFSAESRRIVDDIGAGSTAREARLVSAGGNEYGYMRRDVLIRCLVPWHAEVLLERMWPRMHALRLVVTYLLNTTYV